MRHSARRRLPAPAADFLARQAKNCDGCRYCVQTDKTGQRKLAYIEAFGQKKCPYYPGFCFNWRKVDQTLCENLLATLDAVDEVLDKQA